MKNLLCVSALVLGVGSVGLARAESAAAGAGKMVHCPASVKGAKVEITDGTDAVLVTVTGKADAEAEIRKRAAHLVEAAKGDPTSVAHTGDGHGGGGLGHCVVVLKDTTVTAEDVPGGSKITVKPTKPVDLEWLKKETHTRNGDKPAKKPAK